MSTKTHRRRKVEFHYSGKKLRIYAAALMLVAIVYVSLLFPYDSFAVRISPKRANYYLSWEIPSSKITELAKWDLLVLDMETQVKSLGALKKIRELNPDIIMLVYITPQEIKNDAASGASVMRKKLAAGINPLWYLTDIGNNKLSFWPGTSLLNVADNSPEINGLQLNKYIAQFVAQDLLSTGLWDGVFYDNAWKDVKWLTGDSVDLNKDGQQDSDIDLHWREGTRAIYRETRALTNNRYLVVGNATSEVYKNDLNGIMLENFPASGWEETMRVYNSNQEGSTQPRINIINANTGNTGKNNDFKKFRFGLASTLLINGYYSFDFGDKDHAQTWWYNEYDIELGKPLSPAVSLNGASQFKPGIWRREYENGIALVNSGAESQDIDLGGEYEKIKGAQDTSVNDGAIVNEVSLKAKDGLVMLRTFQSLKNVVFSNGNFVRFFDQVGNRARNGLFVYENNVPGGAKVYNGDLNGNGTDEKIMATSQKLEIFNAVGGIWFQEYPFGRNTQSNLRVTVGKLSDSPEDSIVVSQDKGGQIIIYNYHGSVEKDVAYPLGKKYKGGLVAAVAKEKDKPGKIVIGAGGGRLPEVIVYDRNLSKISKRFFVDTKKLKGDLGLAVGDLNGDDIPEIIIAFSSGTNKKIKAFNFAGKQLSQFTVSAGFITGPISLGAADVDFDGKDEIILMNGE